MLKKISEREGEQTGLQMKEAIMGTRIWMLMAGVAMVLLIVVVVAVVAPTPSGGSPRSANSFNPGSTTGATPPTTAAAPPVATAGTTTTDPTIQGPAPTTTTVPTTTTATTMWQAELNDMLTVAAQQLGITPAELTAELQAGKSIAAVANERGADVAAILDALLAPRIADLEAQVADGQITQAIADRRISMMRTTLAEQLSRAGGPQPQGPGQGPGQGMQPGQGRGPGMGPGQGMQPGQGRGPGMGPGQGRGPGQGMQPGQGQCSGPGYADSDGDGICDNVGTGRPTP